VERAMEVELSDEPQAAPARQVPDA
jgi:hypothetical protein